MALYFDADEMIAKMRAANERALAEARATLTDPIALAFVEAQAELLPALEAFARVHIAARNSGRNVAFVAALAGVISGQIFADVLMNSDEPEETYKIASTYLARAIRGDQMIGATTMRISGQTVGRA